MLRSVASRVAWVGRTASMVFGLALVLALIVGVASMALGANGQPLLLGKNSVATAITRLTANVNGPALQVVNPNAGANDTALSLNVQAGESPMRVNSATKVTNLNADRLDGLDSSLVGRELWAVVAADGTVVKDRGISNQANVRQGVGFYVIQFLPLDVSNCAYTATTAGGFAGQTGVLQGPLNDAVTVFTVNSSGTPTDLPFHLIVTC